VGGRGGSAPERGKHQNLRDRGGVARRNKTVTKKATNNKKRGRKGVNIGNGKSLMKRLGDLFSSRGSGEGEGRESEFLLGKPKSPTAREKVGFKKY